MVPTSNTDSPRISNYVDKRHEVFYSCFEIYFIYIVACNCTIKFAISASVNVTFKAVSSSFQIVITISILDAELALRGYEMFRCDRSTGNLGGGVLLYVRNSLKPVEFLPQTKYPEHTWCKIRGANKDELLIGVCYRSNNTKIYPDGSHDLLRKLVAEVGNHHTLMIGDFNYGGIDWISHTVGAGAGYECQQFLDSLEDNFFTQHVDVSTRGNSLLDLILSNEPDLVTDVNCLENLGTSDHNVLICSVHMQGESITDNKMAYDYNKADFKGLKYELQKADWELMLQGGVEDCWKAFKVKILSLEKQFVPTKKRSGAKKGKPIWMTHRVVKLVKNKRKVFAKYKDKDHPAVRKINKQAKKEVKKARKSFEKKLAKNIKQDKKSFFAYMRSKTKVRPQMCPLTDSKGRCLDGLSDIVEEFNTYFTSVFTEESLGNIPDPVTVFSERDSKILYDFEITVEDVRSKLSKIRMDKSGGPDELKPRLLANIYEEITIPLCHIFNKSLKEGIVPEDWKRANVSPIFKNGSKNCAGNYRPVSLTSQICKVFEALMRDAIVGHLEDNLLLRESQHGFRRGRSCLSNLLTFLDKVSGYMDEGENVDVLFLDFAKAFDKVPHQRLSKKLVSHGIDGKVRIWIEQWLSGRLQRVGINGNLSSWQRVTSGVPQGSVLGPVLFLIYINDLEDGVTNWILKFADDTKMFGKVNNQREADIMQKDIDRLVQWSVEWQMLFNVKKCKTMHIGKQHAERVYTMNGCRIDTVTEEKDLGVVIRNDLKSSSQCTLAYNKANRMLGVINRTVSYKTKEVMTRLYKTLVRPLLEFCTAAWSPYYVKDKDQLERIQHRFTRMIPMIKELPYEQRLEHLGLWTLEERRNRSDLIEVFKMHKGLTKMPFDRFFELKNDQRTRGHPLKLVKKRCKTDLRQHFFSERVINRWNNLSVEAVESTSLNVFKKKMNLLRETRKGLFRD